MVFRVFVEKKPSQALEASTLTGELRGLLNMTGLEKVRVINRYDAENIDPELFDYATRAVFSEPQLDDVTDAPDLAGADAVFAVEYLPGQFDQRADSAAQCIQIISRGERPRVRSAKVYALYGKLSETEVAEIKKYVINPVEAREAVLTKPETLSENFSVPTEVSVMDGFREMERDALQALSAKLGLAMDTDDLAFCRDYFRAERRDPTITEIRMIDTYWSDHCRHTTFLTHLDKVSFDDPLIEKAYADYLAARESLNAKKPVCLMDLATVAVKVLKKKGLLDKLDESEEINACTVKIEVEADGVKEPWLLLFKNETHNHPTEIEPFGGAATCIGGAIRDPLSGRSYVYGAMRVTGAADPTVPVSETIPGKLPQRKLVTTAAAGYSSYGNQIGLATGIVDEIYHPGYAAKRMEIGAVIAATPVKNVRREEPAPGDDVILLGGSTGRDGIGGATGSSKAHNTHSVETCGAEVQKGNAPEERKLQRLFRDPTACRMIKRCNDFGAGGVSVAIGELADGLDIDLNRVPRKYEGLDGTELAISESQERMAVVVAPEDTKAFLALAEKENLQACPVAKVRAEKRLVMRWNGKKIVDISREFLNSNGAEKHTEVRCAAPQSYDRVVTGGFEENLRAMAKDLNICSHRGLSERFDSTIGAGTVLMPFGGRLQLTPAQAMVQKISMEQKHTDDCSLMAWGYNPLIASRSPYHGAYLAVVESVCKLIAAGASFKDVYLTFQEYFEKPGNDPLRWGKPLSALLGAFRAQTDLGVAAIGGKDSMSGSFEKLDVPPTLVSFAVTTSKTGNIVSGDFKRPGDRLYRLTAQKDENGLPEVGSLKALFDRVAALNRQGAIRACWTPGFGGVAEGVMKMAFGNWLGFRFEENIDISKLFGYDYASFLIETEETLDNAELMGYVTEDGRVSQGTVSVSMDDLLHDYEARLEGVYPSKKVQEGAVHTVSSLNLACKPRGGMDTIPSSTASAGKPQGGMDTIPSSVASAGKPQGAVRDAAVPAVRCAKPKVLIPVFPGTNCEYDSARAVRDAGAEARVTVINNLSSDGIRRSVDEFAALLKDSQMIFIPGGFSGGDEPDGSGKFITAFFRNEAVREGVEALLSDRDGLICGICNGFQALIKLGLVPFGHITDPSADTPTLTFNRIGRHQSRIVRTRICSTLSPWLQGMRIGDIVNVPISHGEGRFLADETWLRRLEENGQIATQYVDLSGEATMDIAFNPNGSALAIEGITSPDGRVFGKMGHSERVGSGLYQNVPGNYDIRMFESAVNYFLRGN